MSALVSGPRAGLLLCLVLLAGPVRALEPTTVSVLGVVDIEPENVFGARDLAFRAALLEAVIAVAARSILPEVMEVEEERLRLELETDASAYVLTYRVEGPVGRRPSPHDLLSEQFVLGLRATVDAAALRERLRSLGVLRDRRGRASLILRVLQVMVPPGQSPAPLAAFEGFLVERLEGAGLVVVDPALRPAVDSRPRSALEWARELGADLAVDVGVRWQSQDVSLGVSRARVEVALRAFRTHDGFEVARARFEAPAYHADPAEAIARALEALQEQLADNLILQLGRNWRVLATQDEPIQLRLLNASSLLQIDAVRAMLRGPLEAEEVRLVLLAPLSAELLVRTPHSPGALQSQLGRAVFPGFQLRPIEVAQHLVELRVEPLLEQGPMQGPRGEP